MEPVIIVLMIIGVVFLIASCFIQETFAKKDIDILTKMSESELKMIIEKQLGSAKIRMGETMGELLDETLETAKRGLEKETNQKIMAVSEYSDTVLESINKTHNEIMFLYSMLNDKHVELTQFANSLKQITSQQGNMATNTNLFMQESNSLLYENYGKEVESNDSLLREEKEIAEFLTGEKDTMESGGKTEKILALHRNGKTDVEIAKDLGCGLGEVRLVLGLYKEENVS